MRFCMLFKPGLMFTRTFMLLVCCLFAEGLLAQSSFVVRDIRIEGLQRISDGTVFNYLPVNIGDTLDQKRIQESMRAVYATGFFKNVELRRDGDALIIAVLERPSIESFTIEGNKDIKTEDLQQPLADIGLKAGRTFNRSVLDEVEQSLTDQYFSQGKYAAKVNAEVEEVAGNKVRIAIKIVEGDRARIRQINLVGNTTYSDKDLLEAFELKTPHWLSFIRQDDRYSREALSGDLESLRSYYMDRGFADFSIESTQVAISPEKEDIFITVNIIEGDRYKISDVRLAGDLILTEQQLNPFVQVKPGQIYSQRLISSSAELIRLRLGEEGYSFATVEPVPELDVEEKTVELTLYVDPKNRVYVRRINFNGADSVTDEVFRREMRQFESGFLSNNRVERSRVRLQRLPYIEEVAVETNPVPGTPDLVDVDFEIKEGLPGQFGGGVGYSESQKMIFNANFVHTNFFGTGTRVAADLNTGQYRTIYSLSHTNPYSTINGVSRTLSMAYRDITQFTADASELDTQTLSARVEYSYPFTEFQTIVLGFGWNAAELLATTGSTLQAQEWVLHNGDTFIESGVGGTKFSTYELIAGWIYDSRNRSLFADRGSRQSLILNYSLPIADVEYYTMNYSFLHYMPLTRWFTLSFKADIRFGEALGDTTALPPFRNHYAGGPNTVRGFRENGLGPHDSFGNPYGGNLLTVSQTQLILPIPNSWRSRARFTLFFDVGNVFSTDNVTFYNTSCSSYARPELCNESNEIRYDFDTDDLKYSYGIAAEWLAPLGLFRFSYAFPQNQVPYEADGYFGDRSERFQFSIGGAF
ncbi:MAG: outer membrane protein assembly factor BamA [Chromatiales bacterium]|nr:outer membrane protein assembly factor BamA [Chromatiales bacterium]